MKWTRKPTPTVWLFCDGSTGAQQAAERQARRQTAAPTVAPDVRRLLQADSQCAAAAVARAEDGRILDWAWETLPPLPNNEAEYAGLILGLGLAQRLRAQTAICVLDSAVVVGQMQGRFNVHSASLRKWHWQACAAARAVPSVHYCLVPREWNRLADGLAVQASIPWPVLRQAIAQVQETDLPVWVGDQ